MNGKNFRISQRSCSPEAGFVHPLFALYVKFLYLPAFRTSVFPMCSLLHRTHSAASPRPAMIPSPLFPALIPILAQVLVVAQALPDKKVLSTGPRPMFPSLSDTDPLARPAALYPSPCQTLCQCCSSRAERLCGRVRDRLTACDASPASPANGRIHFVRHLRLDILPRARPLRAKRPWRTSCSAVIPGQGHAILSTNELKMPTSLARAGNTVSLYPHTVIYCLWRPNLLHACIKICTFSDIALLVQITSICAKISTKWHYSF